MRKVTTYQIIEGIKKNITTLLLPAALAFAIVFGHGYSNYADLYEAKAVLIASVQDGDEISYNRLMLNEKLANIYSEVLKTPDLYENVAKGLEAGGSGDNYKEVMKKSNFEVNPQAGLISFTYKDADENEARDGLKLLCENFRLMVKDYLGADNLSYLNQVMVEKPSMIKLLIFSLVAAVGGLALGLVIIIIKTLLSDKIASMDDLKELGYDVLARDDEYFKIKAKITNRLDDGIIGISSIGNIDSFAFSEKLAKAFSTNNGILFVDSKNRSEIDKKYLSQKESFKVIRKVNIDYIGLSGKNSREILDSDEFFAELANRENSYNYIMIDEKSLRSQEPFLTARLCDMKIILVDDSCRKSDLDKAIRDLSEAGISYCGVVYHK